ncbi:MAG: hypothetical protein PHF86_07740 [Candidatus Nanoarchaeia archaeon]|jgi:hypothetical protein|nr:hypothetical protein [Candidatus Nanoarchaeia archaeon]
MKNPMISELSRVSSEASKFDEEMSKDLNKFASLLSTNDLFNYDLDDIVEEVEKKASLGKQSKLINKDDIVVCVDNYDGIFKGRRYHVVDADIPGYLGISELDGTDVGVFAINRFVLDNNEQ